MSPNDLFEQPANKRVWIPAQDRAHPLIELTELVLLEVFAPAASIEIRRIEFRPGLNIVWADPKVAEALESEDRTSGHSAGKTTLCRILRWLLGESHFGNKDLESRIGVKFKNGWALLALKIDGKPWVVGRSFFSKQDHQAVEGADLETILKQGWPEDASARPFLDELEAITIKTLAKDRFPGRRDDIKWHHLLAWLARDQEASLQSVDAWRSTVSGPQERAPTKFERHILLRLIADLLSPEEWEEMDAEKKNNAELTTLAEQLPGIKAVADESCKPLLRFLKLDGDVISSDLVISNAANILEEDREQLRKVAETIEQHAFDLAQKNHEQALRELERAKGQLLRKTRRYEDLKKKVGELGGAIIKAKAVLEMRTPPPGYCARKKTEIEDKCEFYQDGIENIAAASLWADLEKQQQGILEQLDAEDIERAELEATIPLLMSNEENTRLAAEAASTERDELLKLHERIQERISTYEPMFLPADERWHFYEAQMARVNVLGEENKGHRQRQSIIRDRNFWYRLDLSEHYRSVLSSLLGPKINGHINFDTNGQLVLDAENRSSLSSAAIEALKTISFDLASLFRSIVGGGHHPRFLIHDSPKVADMSPVPYAELFELALQVEKQANGRPNFQYIITTTEPPPDHFKNSGHIILPLDASTKEGRLFMEDL
jgi:hypothetical protein